MTEEDNHRLYVATSYVRIASSKDLHRQPLRCVAMHESHSTKSQDAEVRLDVHCEYRALRTRASNVR